MTNILQTGFVITVTEHWSSLSCCDRLWWTDWFIQLLIFYRHFSSILGLTF